MGATPNDVLRAVRVGMRMSQDEFAQAVQAAGARLGEPNDANKRLVQRWESGEIRSPQPRYARALQALTGQPIELLGFPTGLDAMVVDDGRGGHDLEVRMAALPAPGAGRHPQGNYSGVWLSRYEYFSSSRNDAYSGLHHVVLLQHGDRVTVRSIPGSANSSMSMDLTVDRNIVTGVWVEETNPDGYYRGARYHGAIQMLAEPTGRRMTGKWLGFGKDYDVNTGPWTLTFQDASTSKATIERYSQPPAT
jgi:DNA-binding transcriptional regulator YiaG